MMPPDMQRDPAMATCRKVKRRNMGPLRRPVQADTAGFVLIMAVISELDIPRSASRSRKRKPNCCRQGYMES